MLATLQLSARRGARAGRARERRRLARAAARARASSRTASARSSSGSRAGRSRSVRARTSRATASASWRWCRPRASRAVAASCTTCRAAGSRCSWSRSRRARPTITCSSCARPSAEEEQPHSARAGGAVLAGARAAAALIETLVPTSTRCARGRAGRVSWAAAAITPGGSRLQLRARAPSTARHERAAMHVVPLDLELSGRTPPAARERPEHGREDGAAQDRRPRRGRSRTPRCRCRRPKAAQSPSSIRCSVDLGDEQSVDQGLSTFAAHLRSLGAMADEAAPKNAAARATSWAPAPTPKRARRSGARWSSTSRRAARGAW